MNLATVMDEVGDVLETITGLRVTPYPVESASAPAGLVSYPESIDFDQTYGRGSDRITGLPVWLLAGKVTTRSARETVAGWTAGTGTSSVKAKLEAHSWTSCDDLFVRAAEFDTVSLAGVDYLAAIFTLDIIGSAS